MATASKTMLVNRFRAVRSEIGAATQKRSELWQTYGEDANSGLMQEIDRLTGVIDALWREARSLNAEIRHGRRAEIMARARRAERVERYVEV